MSTSMNLQKSLISRIHFVLCPNSVSWGIISRSGGARSPAAYRFWPNVGQRFHY